MPPLPPTQRNIPKSVRTGLLDIGHMCAERGELEPYQHYIARRNALTPIAQAPQPLQPLLRSFYLWLVSRQAKLTTIHHHLEANSHFWRWCIRRKTNHPQQVSPSLINAYLLGLYAAGEQERWERLLGDPTLSPVKKLRRYFKDLITTYGVRGGPIAGCLLGNMSLEVAGQKSEIRKLLLQAFDAWQNALAKTVREAIEKQEIPKTARPDDIAALLVNGWEGAQVRAKALQNDKPLNLFFDNSFNVLLRG